jgi:hypothetical protein
VGNDRDAEQTTVPEPATTAAPGVAPGVAPGTDAERAAAWSARPVRMGPALIVVGIVAVIVVGGVLLAALGSSKPPAPDTGRSAAGLGVETAARALAPIVSGGVPPPDVLAALVVPAGATRTGTTNEADQASTYDESARFTLDARPKSVVAFYTTELKRARWTDITVDAAATGNGTELYGTRAGSDGHYWEVGIRVERASGSLSNALAGDTPTPSSTFVLRLEEVDDDD